MNGGRDDNGGGRRRRRHRGNFSQKRDDQTNKAGTVDVSDPLPRRNRSSYDKNGTFYERPNWIAPQLNTDPLPSPECVYCGKQIRDIDAAIQDKQSGKPVHFDCVLTRLAERETLERGDVISYIGGGRFGVVHFSETRSDFRKSFPQDIPGRVFIIKKIFEWEDKESRADWREAVADHYSLT